MDEGTEVARFIADMPHPVINGVGNLARFKANIKNPAENWLESHLDNPAFTKIAKKYGGDKTSYGNIIADSDQLENWVLQSIPYEERRELLLLSQTPPESRVADLSLFCPILGPFRRQKCARSF